MGGKRGPRKFTIPDEELIRLYSVDLVRVNAIAVRYGVTRQTVNYRLKQLGVVRYKRKVLHVACINCGEMYDYWPSQAGGKYCGRRCFFEKTSKYGRYSRQGQRVARRVSGAWVGEIAHHIDGDTMNNEAWNLVVFPSNASHMSFHKSGNAEKLKEMLPAIGVPEWGGPHREDWAYETLGIAFP